MSPEKSENTKIKKQITQKAKDIGFDLVGFTNADPFPRDEKAATNRIDLGFMDGLPWYTKERVKKANNPKLLMENCESIISLGISYFTPTPEKSKNVLTGKISKYALGVDYHKVIKKKLKLLVKFLSEIHSEKKISTRIFVDDGPMNDRAAAERAGLGWFGKNTNILTPSHGSWIFLAQILTNIKLEPDTLLKKTCGSCKICIDDCPTNAIVAPYVIDNTKCISFLTIELKGVIPVKLRPLIGTWIFGCDICQDVCPVNRKIQPSKTSEFQPRKDFLTPALLPFLDLNEDSFNKIFDNHPIKRTKLIGLKRNVCVALGNIKDTDAIEKLTKTLLESDPIVKQHAAWAIGQIGGDKANQNLHNALEVENNTDVIEEIKSAIIQTKMIH